MNILDMVRSNDPRLSKKWRNGTIKKIGALNAATVSTEVTLATALDPETGFVASYTVPSGKRFYPISLKVSSGPIANNSLDNIVKVKAQYMNSAIRLANNLKAVINVHFADETEHTAGAQAAITAADATDLTTLIALVTALLAAYAIHDADVELGSGWAYHVAQEGADESLASEVAPTTVAECKTRLTDLLDVFDDHQADGTAHTDGDSGAATAGAIGTTDILSLTHAGVEGLQSEDVPFEKDFDVSNQGFAYEEEAVIITWTPPGDGASIGLTLTAMLTGIEVDE